MYLIDTHIFIWWNSDMSKLNKSNLKILENPKNLISISVVSLWEIIIKRKLGKLTFNQDILQMIDKNGFEILNIIPDHILELDKLFDHHKDPFDRLLMAQAKFEKFHLISQDEWVNKYTFS